jgi:nickel transport protein
MKTVLLGFACLTGIVALDTPAHQISMRQDQTQATRVTLSYADGSPFAYESYALYPTDADLPTQLGRTDALGRFLFIADGSGEWRIKAFSENGHGIDTRFQVLPADTQVQATGGCQLNRMLALLAGLGAVFGIFGLIQLSLRRRPNPK